MTSGAAGSVRVRLLDGGSLATADISVIHAGAGSTSFRLYDWCFYIFHEPSNTHLLWDVGISSVGIILGCITALLILGSE